MRGKGWAAVAVGVGMTLGGARSGEAQGLYPPAPGAELERLSRRMAEAVRDLGEDLTARAGQLPAAQYLDRDAQELGRATGDWYASIQGKAADPYQVRRSYAGIDAAWHRLRSQLDAPGVATPEMADEIARVEQVDAQIHQALQLNGYPPGFASDPNAAPSSQDELARLAYAAAQRGEALAATVQVSYGADPNAARLISESADLARSVDAFYDALVSPDASRRPADPRMAFSQIVQQSNDVGAGLATTAIPPRVRAAIDSYGAAVNLIRAKLDLLAPTSNGLPAPAPIGQPDPAPYAGGIPYNANPAAQIGQWADDLDRQVDELLANFAPTAPVVPEGRAMLDEMTRLRDDTRRFRVDASQGIDPGRLAYRFRDVDADCQRLARHFARIARGRTGPNIERVQRLSQTCEQIHQALGMPGYPPAFGPYDPPPEPGR